MTQTLRNRRQSDAGGAQPAGVQVLELSAGLLRPGRPGRAAHGAYTKLSEPGRCKWGFAIGGSSGGPKEGPSFVFAGFPRVMVPGWMHPGLWEVGGCAMTLKDVETHVRYGAFLRAIPPSRRIGDYAHAAARIVNAIFKRLLEVAPQWGHNAAANLRLDAHSLTDRDETCLGSSVQFPHLPVGPFRGDDSLQWHLYVASHP